MARRTPPPRGPQLELAGELGVAFVNTAGARPENRQLGVDSFEGFVTWSRAVGTVSAPEAERLLRWAAERPAEAEAAFALVATLRASLAESFLAAQRGEPAAESGLEAFNRALAASSLAPRLVAAESGAAWAWAGAGDALDVLLSPILLSAQEVMAAARGRPHVRRCAAPDCRLFFVDRSPTSHRKWCAMKTCGRRGKNRRHYRRVVKGDRKQAREEAIPKPRRRS